MNRLDVQSRHHRRWATATTGCGFPWQRVVRGVTLAVLTVVWQTRGTAEPVAVDGLAERLQKLPTNVLSDQQRRQLADAIHVDLRNRLQAANQRSSGLWRKIQSCV